MAKNPEKNTTVTIKQRELFIYKELRKKVNEAFKERFNVQEAFTMSGFFGVIMIYIERNLEDLIEAMMYPDLFTEYDPSFTWDESKTEAKKDV